GAAPAAPGPFSNRALTPAPPGAILRGRGPGLTDRGGRAMDSSTADRLTFLRRLRAVKEYTPEPIPDPVIEDILEVGRWSASGGNRQPWQVVVIRDPEVKQKLGEWG